MKLEKMDDFFAARVSDYDEHMKTNIEGASVFYAYTASLLPAFPGAKILDLGCGTGLELEELFRRNPAAAVTGIDLSGDMLGALKKKLPGYDITLIQGSYFDVPFERGTFDSAVSVESLHHFTAEMKVGLYKKLHCALKAQGYFVLTDYFAGSDAMEAERFNELDAVKQAQGISDDTFYHYDTPLTVEHEISALREAGFARVRELRQWGCTHTLLAEKQIMN